MFHQIQAGLATPKAMSSDQTFQELVGALLGGNTPEVLSFQSLDFKDRRTKDYKERAQQALDEGLVPVLGCEADEAGELGRLAMQHPLMAPSWTKDTRVHHSTTFVADLGLEVAVRPTLVVDSTIIWVKVLKSLDEIFMAARNGKWLLQLALMRLAVENVLEETCDTAILAIERSEAPSTRLVQINFANSALKQPLDHIRAIKGLTEQGAWENMLHQADDHIVKSVKEHSVFDKE